MEAFPHINEKGLAAMIDACENEISECQSFARSCDMICQYFTFRL